MEQIVWDVFHKSYMQAEIQWKPNGNNEIKYELFPNSIPHTCIHICTHTCMCSCANWTLLEPCWSVLCACLHTVFIVCMQEIIIIYHHGGGNNMKKLSILNYTFTLRKRNSFTEIQFVLFAIWSFFHHLPALNWAFLPQWWEALSWWINGLHRLHTNIFRGESLTHLRLLCISM